MSIKKWPGAVVSDTPVVPAGPYQDGTASGVWTLDQVAYWQKQGLWPVAGNVAPKALIGSGSFGSARIDYIVIPSGGNSESFGDLTVARIDMSACASSTIAVWAGGYNKSNVMDYVTIATTGNATDFGDLTDGRMTAAGFSNSTRGVFGGGEGTVNPTDIIDYITIASTGNATDFGNLTVARLTYGQGAASPTKGVWLGGQGVNSGVVYNTIDYITILSEGNATDFGDLLATARLGSACSNNTRAVVHMGVRDGVISNALEYITFESTGNSIDFGDLVTARYGTGATSNSITGVFIGGSNTAFNQIDKITLSSLGNATDFGDLAYNANNKPAATSGQNGGL